MLKGFLGAVLLASSFFGAISSSSHYQLQSYGVNSGGTNSASSTTYKARAAAGEIGNSAGAFSSNYSSYISSTQTAQASTPPAPAVDNGSGTYYNKLHFVINTTANPSDATFAVRIWNLDLGANYYIQTDGTMGANPVYRTYAAWGGSSGSFAIGLNANAQYYMWVSAQEGKFSASAYSPPAIATTATPSLTFSVSPSSLNLGNLSAGSIVTSSTITFSYTANAASGGYVYMAGSATGLVSTSNSNYNIKVTQPSGDLTSLGEGSGLQATGTASMVAQSPYASGGSTVGAFYTTFQPVFIASGPVSTGSPTAVVKAKAQATTPTGTDYTNTLTFVAAASY